MSECKCQKINEAIQVMAFLADILQDITCPEHKDGIISQDCSTPKEGLKRKNLITPKRLFKTPKIEDDGFDSTFLWESFTLPTPGSSQNPVIISSEEKGKDGGNEEKKAEEKKEGQQEEKKK